MGQVLQLTQGSESFGKLAPQLEKIVGNPAKNIPPSPNKGKLIDGAIKRTNSTFWVNDPLDMLLEMEGKGFVAEESDLHHRLTLAVASGTAEKEQYFNTNEATVGEHQCNIQEASQMAKESVFFIKEIYLTPFDDASLDEIKRIQQDAIFKIQFRQGTDYLKRKALYIPSIDLVAADRLGVAQGMVKAADAANSDTFRIKRVHPRGIGWVLPRFFKLPENIPFTCYLDFVGTVATAIACDCELTFLGILGSKKA